ncbi:MAG: pyruvoyl-dependent arginine decarboxylase [Candidatus Hodarchaeota archaeon]
MSVRTINFIPKEMFLTKGKGIHKEHLESFELALREAGIHFCNIVSVSSIIPPDCKIISREEGLEKLEPGQIIFTVLSRNSTNEYGRIITASIGLAQLVELNAYGYVSEHHAFGQSKKESGDYAEDLAVSMLASTRGLAIPKEELEYDPQREMYKLPKAYVTTESLTQDAKGVKEKWVTVLASAVFIL